MPAFPRPGLYAILDTAYTRSDDWESKARSLLRGGAGVLQVRAKNLPLAAIAPLVTRVLPLCRDHGVPCIVNDHPSVARDTGADGLHLGQDDGDAATARALLGPDRWVGRSTHSPAQATAAAAEGVDYIGFGPIHPTGTKPGRPAIGLAMLATVSSSLAIPVFAIGGIHPGNLDEVLAAGARHVVMVSALLTAADTAATTQDVVSRLSSHGKTFC